MRWSETNAHKLEDVRRSEAFRETMELRSDWSHQPPVEFQLCAEPNSSCGELEGESDACRNIWTDAEPARVKTCVGHSFTMEARRRLDNLKSGCGSPAAGGATSRSLYSYNYVKDLWDSEESALDAVQILDIEEDEHDEESWLYKLPNKALAEGEPALRWCRCVLDNPSPEMEAARRSLMNKLDQRWRHPLYRQPALLHRAASLSARPSSDTTSTRSTLSYDHNELSDTQDSITTGYRLQDMTDVHIMAQIQEASLRQDYISMPSTVSSMTNPESTSSLSSSTVGENKDYFMIRNKSRAGSKSLSTSPCRSPTLAAKQSCQSPRLARLHQQVTQFRLLKRAQTRGASPARTSSPLRTSLRSLQAVRNSRSLESDDDCVPAEQSTPPPLPPPGVSSVRMESSGWSAISSGAPPLLKKGSALRNAAMKSLQRSHSLSPCRIPHPAKGFLSVTGRVFASPERTTTGAWSRNMPLIHR